MADFVLDINVARRTGTSITYNAVSGAALTPTLLDNDRFIVANDGQTVIHFVNGATDDTTISINTPGDVDGLAIASRVVPVANAGNVLVGPFQPSIYNNASRQLVITLTNPATLTAAPIRI